MHGKNEYETYEALARKHRDGFGALAYSIPESQSCRFEAVARMMKLVEDGQGLSVLDVGCGLGDFSSFIRGKMRINRYVGVDVVPEMLEVASRRYPHEEFRPGTVFDVRESFDVVVGISIFTVKEDLVDENARIMHQTFKRMYENANKLACVAVLSTQKASVRYDEFVTDPWELARWAQKEIDERVVVDHQEMPHEVFVGVIRGQSPWKKAYEAARKT